MACIPLANCSGARDADALHVVPVVARGPVPEDAHAVRRPSPAYAHAAQHVGGRGQFREDGDENDERDVREERDKRHDSTSQPP